MSDPEAVPRPLQMQQPATSALRARVFSAQLGTWYGVWEYDADDPDCEGEQCGGGDLPGTLPDLSDSATLGCVYDLACEALGVDAIDVSVGVAPDMSGLLRVLWAARTHRRRRVANGSTLSRHVRQAAYVAALEAADDQ